MDSNIILTNLSGTTAGTSTNIQQRIPLPGPEMLEEEPLYVNAKQYHRSLSHYQWNVLVCIVTSITLW